MYVTFKSNLPKKELIQKDKEARQMLGDRSECAQNPHPFHQSNAHPAALFNKDNDLFILTDLESEKKRCYWLFFIILLSYLIIIYGLPVDALQYIDLFGLYCVFVIMNVTLAEILLEVILQGICLSNAACIVFSSFFSTSLRSS